MNHHHKIQFIDLGEVGDIAEVILNNLTVGVRAWQPYTLALGNVCQEGVNQLQVRVTNSMANKYEGLQKPSGLMRPIVLRSGKIFPI